MPHPILQLLAKIGPPLLKKVAASLMQPSEIQKAIAATEEEFPGIEVRQALNAWVKSNQFAELLRRFSRQGERDFPESTIVTSFVAISEFYLAADTEAKAGEVVTAFLRNLEDALYLSSDAIPVLAARMESMLISSPARHAVFGDVPQKVESAQDPSVVARIDMARDLIDKGLLAAARQVLAPLEEMIRRGAVDANLSYRIVMNQGVIALTSEDFERAQVYLNSALFYRPDDARAAANLAQVAIAREQYSEAQTLVARAKCSAPDDPLIAAVEIGLLSAQSKFEAIDALLKADPRLGNQPLPLLVAGEASYSNGEFEKAEERAKRLTALDAGNPHVGTSSGARV